MDEQMPTGQQLVAIAFFHFPRGNKWWAFSQMRRGPSVLSQQEGMVFSKLMGAGKGAGFSFWPDFSVYAMLTVFEDAASFHHFSQNEFWNNYQHKSDEQLSVILRPLKVKGEWNKQQPFDISRNEPKTELRAVITRASIRWSRLIPFWRQVPSTSRAIEEAEGRIFSAGVGEWPWIEQSTFSLWESEEMMKKYAYRNRAHQEAIRKTEKLNWYKEELFARFEPLATIGNWKGKQILKPYGIKSFEDVPPLAELQALASA